MDVLYRSTPFHLPFLGMDTTAFLLGKKLVGLAFDKDADFLQAWLLKRINCNQIKEIPFPNQLKTQLEEYSMGKRIDFSVDVTLIGTPFQKGVWNQIQKIPYGLVTDYKNIAHSLGCKGYRAVGTAVKHNPIPIIVPCHRVLPADGSLGNYSMGQGPETKKKLLQIEKLEVM